MKLERIIEAIGRAPTDDLPAIAAEAINTYLRRPDGGGAGAVVAALALHADEPWIFEELCAAFDDTKDAEPADPDADQ